MPIIARAYCNNEVASVAWRVDAPIPDCLGFEVVRVYLDADGRVAQKPDGSEDRVSCATWVAFKGQRNKHWLPQSTSVWPVQKLSWRDLTLRRKRDKATLRPDNVRVRYEIRPLGDLKPGMGAAPDPTPAMKSVVKRDDKGKPVVGPDSKWLRETVPAYQGKPRPLGYLGPAVSTNPILVTRKRGAYQSTFTNGILAAQWLRNVLYQDGVKEPGELLRLISTPGNNIRNYLAGDVLPMLRELFEREGSFLLALYELEDDELLELILANKDRLRIILANTGNTQGVENSWDQRNAPARQALIDAGVDIQHRMFNQSGPIGHNKFVVHIATDGVAQAVFTGSTNWTSTGIAGQTNNALLIENADVAAKFADYWQRMFDDPLPMPAHFYDDMDNWQGDTFRKDNAVAIPPISVGAGKASIWFSPNMKSHTKKKDVPPDLQEVYRLMRQAKKAILFLAFYPGQSGNDCIIGEAVDIAEKDGSLLLAGAISDAKAMPGYKAANKMKGEKGASPITYQTKNVSLVRASRIDDKALLGDFGAEELTARGVTGAIIHDKLVVVDPLSDDCAVVFGSHNLGFKASYFNDENMLIIQGDRALSEAYAVHILDVYDHYRFRAVQAELKSKGKKGWSGFLETSDKWLQPYLDGKKGALMDYFARGG